MSSFRYYKNNQQVGKNFHKINLGFPVTDIVEYFCNNQMGKKIRKNREIFRNTKLHERLGLGFNRNVLGIQGFLGCSKCFDFKVVSESGLHNRHLL